MIDRRQFLNNAAMLGGGFAVQSLLPAWAQTGTRNNITGIHPLAGNEFHLHAERARGSINSKRAKLITINGHLPPRFFDGVKAKM